LQRRGTQVVEKRTGKHEQLNEKEEKVCSSNWKKKNMKDS
jgi:hypothetical protein